MLLYDADCAFCTRAARLGMKLTLQARIRPIQSVDLAGLGIDPARARREIPFVDAHGDVCYGAAAIAGALGTGKAPCRAASWVMRSWPTRYAARAIYRVVARNRHRLPGGSAACETDRQSSSTG